MIDLLFNQSKQIDQMENTLKQMKKYFIEYQTEIIDSIGEKIIDTEIKIEGQTEMFSSLEKNKSILFSSF